MAANPSDTVSVMVYELGGTYASQFLSKMGEVNDNGVRSEVDPDYYFELIQSFRTFWPESKLRIESAPLVLTFVGEGPHNYSGLFARLPSHKNVPTLIIADSSCKENIEALISDYPLISFYDRDKFLHLKSAQIIELVKTKIGRLGLSESHEDKPSSSPAPRMY